VQTLRLKHIGFFLLLALIARQGAAHDHPQGSSAMNGMQAALEIRKISPRTKILFLTVVGAEEAAAGARFLADG
jgi:hypothetical protein